MPAEHKDKLTKAAKLLADVQQDMSKRHDRGSREYIHTWQDLYWLREKLDELVRYGFVLYHGDLPAVKSSCKRWQVCQYAFTFASPSVASHHGAPLLCVSEIQVWTG